MFSRLTFDFNRDNPKTTDYIYRSTLTDRFNTSDNIDRSSLRGIMPDINCKIEKPHFISLKHNTLIITDANIFKWEKQTYQRPLFYSTNTPMNTLIS